MVVFIHALIWIIGIGLTLYGFYLVHKEKKHQH